MYTRHWIQLIYVLLTFLSGLLLTWLISLCCDISLGSTEQRAARAMEAKLFYVLSREKGAKECQNAPWFFARKPYLYDAPVVWTSANALKAILMPAQSHGDFIMEDRVDLALDYLMDHADVIYWVEDDDVYFTAKVSTYSIPCQMNKFLLWAFDLVGGLIL